MVKKKKMLPRIKINYENGALGSVTMSPDGCLGIVANGEAVEGRFELGKAYVLHSWQELAGLGITETVNPGIEKVVREFYDEAGEGTEVWLMAFPAEVKMSQLVDVNSEYARKLIIEANGRLRGIVVACRPDASYTPTVVQGLDQEVSTSLPAAQALAEWATQNRFAPVFVLLEGRGFTGNAVELPDLTEMSYNRVGVFIGDTCPGSPGSAIGVLAGRIATIPVQRNIGRVKDGALTPLAFYIGDKLASAYPNVELLHDKGYISIRNYVGKAGFFFTDDPLATRIADDYRPLANRRVVDKAYRIAYSTLVEELLEEVPVNEDGTIQMAVAKDWEAKVEQAIAMEMTANGELSADLGNPDDRGVVCYINPAQNVLATSRIVASLKVRPFAYARYIDVNLGFNVNKQ